MGEVLLVRLSRQGQFEKRLVIKRILPQLSQREEFASMFCQEARTAALLSHQNIVQIFDFGEVDGQSYIAMEYVDGVDLAALLAREGRLAPREVLAIAQAALRGLDYAHRVLDPNGEPLGLVHCDIAPKNLLLSREGEIKWIDFGLAKLSQQDGRIAGTPAFMAPEQALGAALDARADIFSMGVSLYVLLTGVLPFGAPEQPLSSYLERVNQRDFALPSERCPELGNHFDLLISRALSADPVDRYPSARDMLDDVDRLIVALGLSAPHELAALVRASSPVLPPAALEPTFVSDEPIANEPLANEPAVALLAALSQSDEREPSAPALASSLSAESREQAESESQPAPGVREPSARARWFWLGAMVLAVGLLAMWGQSAFRSDEPKARSAPQVEASWALELSSEPTGAQVFLEGELLGLSPLRVDGFEAGEYRLVFEKRGWRSHTERVELGPEGGVLQRAVRLDLAQGQLLLSVTPDDAQVKLNEQFLKLDGKAVSLPAGPHSLLVTRTGFQPLLRSVDIIDGQQTTLELVLEPLWASLSIEAEGAKQLVLQLPEGESSECVPPCRFEQLLPGSYRLSMDCSAESTSFSLVAGEQRKLRLDCPSAVEPRRIELRGVGGRLSAKSGSGSTVFVRDETVQFEAGGYQLTAALSLERGGAVLGARVVPWSQLLLDGKRRASPLVDVTLRPGRHSLRLASAPRLGIDIVVPR